MNKGFTLIELLIVVAIIGILSSILVTFLSKRGTITSEDVGFCDAYEDKALKSIPFDCYEHFGIKRM